MFRFVALFALVAVAVAEPEADAQFLVNPYNTVAGVPLAGVPLANTYANHVVNPIVNSMVYNQVPVVKQVLKPVVYNQVPVVKQVVNPMVYNQVPVVKQVVNPIVYSQVPAAVLPTVKYVDPHHTEGMAAGGVPEKTDSVKIAEKQHELAKTIEDSKAKVAYVAPYTTYAGVYPYAHPVAHVVAKREADSESDAESYVTYNGVYGGVYPQVLGATYGAPYNTAVAGFPYTSSVSGYHYQSPVVGHNGVVYRGKRDADSDAQIYNTYATPYATPYMTYGRPVVYNTPYTYGINRNVARWF
jgi:hypothetical protein